MQPHIRFESVGLADRDELALIRVEAMRDSLQRIGRFDPQRAKDRFLSVFSPSHTQFIVLDGQKIGFYVLKQEADGLLLDHLYVKPGYQGQGVGSIVLTTVFAHADRNGLSLRVGALKESDSNRFYIRHGFVLIEQSEFDNYYVRHADSTL